MRGTDIRLWPLAGRAGCGVGRYDRPYRPLEQTEQLFGNEVRSGGIEVTIALRVPVLDEEALRHDQMEVAFVGSNVLPLNEADLIERAKTFVSARAAAEPRPCLAWVQNATSDRSH
jgi:hypothetical protein